MRKTGVLQREQETDGYVAFRRFRGVRRTGGVVPLPSYPTQGNPTMERVTLRIPKQQVEQVERMVETGEYPNRSEAIRAAVREMLAEHDTEQRRPSEQQGRKERKDRSWVRA